MKLPSFDYVAPTSVEETVRVLGEVGNDLEVKILAGGQSLIPLLALRLAQPSCLVDINGLAPELSAIRVEDGHLRIGALVRQRAAERSEIIANLCPLLAEALPMVAHPAIRTRGTVGGSLAHADPAAELPAVALALDATMTAVGPRGVRTIAATEFFQGFLSTALEPDEVLTEISVPLAEVPTGSAFLEVSRRHGDFAMIGVAVNVAMTESIVSDVRIALSGVASTPVRMYSAERALRCRRPDQHAVAEAAAEVGAAIEPPSDIHGSAAYRKHVAKRLTARALSSAIARAAASMRHATPDHAPEEGSATR